MKNHLRNKYEYRNFCEKLPLNPPHPRGRQKQFTQTSPLRMRGKFDPENSGENRGSFSKPVPLTRGGKVRNEQGEFYSTTFFCLFPHFLLYSAHIVIFSLFILYGKYATKRCTWDNSFSRSRTRKDY